MGNPKSKPKREAEVAPKVKINSPTSIETSTGFHLLQFHGPTVSNIVILGAFACLRPWGSCFSIAISARNGDGRRQDCYRPEEPTQKQEWQEQPRCRIVS